MRRLHFALLLFLTLPAAGGAQPPAQSLPQDCSAESRETVQARAATGDRKAQYLLGAQLAEARCGVSDPDSGLALLDKSAEQGYPPALHLLGVIAERQGAPRQAADYFREAARQGFRHAEVNLGFLHAAPGSPMRDPPLAYAWLALATEHEPRPDLRAYLQVRSNQVFAQLDEEARAEAAEWKARLASDFGPIPRFSDDP